MIFHFQDLNFQNQKHNLIMNKVKDEQYKLIYGWYALFLILPQYFFLDYLIYKGYMLQ